VSDEVWYASWEAQAQSFWVGDSGRQEKSKSQELPGRRNAREAGRGDMEQSTLRERQGVGGRSCLEHSRGSMGCHCDERE